MLYNFFPYATDNETFAEAVTRHMKTLGPDDAAVIKDHDVLLTTNDWYPRIERHLANGMQFGTCFTNRLYSGFQIHPDAPTLNLDEAHVTFGKHLARANDGKVTDHSNGKLASGHFLVITKKAWDLITPLETTTIVKLDNEIHTKLREKKIPLFLMEDVYVYHRYRFGERDKVDHLKPNVNKRFYADMPPKTENLAPVPQPKEDPKLRKVCYTVITGNYDTLRQPTVVTPGWEYHVYTDNPKALEADRGVWQVFELPDAATRVMAQRTAKIICPVIAKKGQLLRTIYCDGNMLIVGNLDEFVKTTKHKEGGITSKKHPERNCIYDEAEACKKLKKETPKRIKKTVTFLKREKYGKNQGLSETGILIRDYRGPSQRTKLRLAMKRWEKMVNTYTTRDQLSFNYVMNTGKVEHTISEGNSFNPFFNKQPHTAGKSRIDTPAATPPQTAAAPTPKKSVPTRTASSKYELNIYVSVRPEQVELLPQFLENALRSNPKAHIEVLYPDNATLPDVKTLFAKDADRIMLHPHQWLRNEGNAHFGSYRFLIEPELATKYVYTPDLALQIQEDVQKAFSVRMKETGLRYSNVLRSTGIHMEAQHFTEYNALWPHSFSTHTPEVRSANTETLLLAIVRSKGNEDPTETERPVVGTLTQMIGA